MSLGLIKNFTAAGPIAKYRIVAAAKTDGAVEQAASAAAPLIGLGGVTGTERAGQRIDVCLDGVRAVEYGGDVAFGDLLTSDAQGRAVRAVAAKGSPVRLIGTAMDSGAVGVIGQVHLVPSTLGG